MNVFTVKLIGSVFVAACFAGAVSAKDVTGIKTANLKGADIELMDNHDPASELENFELLDGYQANLFASDPMIANPVHMHWDPALEWTANLSAGAARDAAAEQIVRQLRFRQPDRAAEAARMIVDESFRLESLSAIVDVMTRQDVARAESFVQQGNFSEAEREALLDRVRGGK